MGLPPSMPSKNFARITENGNRGALQVATKTNIHTRSVRTALDEICKYNNEATKTFSVKPAQILETVNPLNTVCVLSALRANRNKAVPSDLATKVPVEEGSVPPVTLVEKLGLPLMLNELL